MDASAAPVKLLLSRAALTTWRSSIEAVLGSRPHVFVPVDEAVAHGRNDIDVAFISRDITGLSTKHELAPELQACYDVMRRSPGLQWVHIHSAGADRPVFVELRQRGVTVTTSSGANAEVVAQTALAGVLALARRLPQMMDAQRAHRWTPLLGAHLPRDLSGQHAMIVGWGPIGQRIGAMLQALGLQVQVIRQRADAPTESGIRMLSFDQMAQALPVTDWLILACPLTARTRGLVNARTLAALPAGASLINVARGEVVCEADLCAALQSGHLGGALLDVFEHEPLPGASPLWDMPQVIVTPHSAGHSDGNEVRVAHLFLDNLNHWCAGRPLRNVVR
jgi:phosphoglycerate dehydrogenase-like enzyme